MKIVKRTPGGQLKESIRILRDYTSPVAPGQASRPGCPKIENGDQEGARCELPAVAPGSHDLVRFHQRIVALALAELTDLTLARARVSQVNMSLGFLQRFEQTWEYRRTTLGRPVSHIALAPLERRRVQVAQKRKTNLSRSDRTKRSSRRTYDSASSTKASNSATNSSTSRNKWSVSAGGSYGIQDVGWGAHAEGSLEGSAEQTRQLAIENLVEETQKSSTEVMAETETTTTIGLQTSFEHIEEHQLVNPYSDRSVLFRLLELVDEFCVHTATAGLAPCLIFDFDPISSDAQRLSSSMKFDESFVSAHRQFLRTALLDDSLVDFIDSQDALATESNDTGEVSDNAVRCLDFLFGDTGVFAPTTEPTFDIDQSFIIDATRSGFLNAREVDATDIYLLLAGVRFLYRRDEQDFQNDALEALEFMRRAVEYVLVLYNGLSAWMGVSVANRRWLSAPDGRTEQFRRIPAFIELAEQLVVGPLKMVGEQPSSATETADTPEGEGDEAGGAAPSSTGLSNSPRMTAQARVVNHLNCFGRYYTEEFLQFLHEWTGVAAIVELMASLDAEHRALVDFVDFERSFVDGTAWIVPFAAVADAQAVADAFLNDSVDLTVLTQIDTEIEVRMPANGVHVEAVPGHCVLPGLTGDSSAWPLPPALYPWTSGSADF